MHELLPGKAETLVNPFRRALAAGCVLLSATLYVACTDQPSPVASSLYPAQNKLIFRALNSVRPADSLSLTYRIFLQHFSGGTLLSNAFIGLFKTYEAREAIKMGPFFQDTSFVDSTEHAGTIKSGFLQVLLSPYRFGDTNSSMPFHCTVNEILAKYDIGATWDSLGATSNYKTTPVGSYNGSIGIEDSILNIPVDTAFIFRLLRYGNTDSLNTYFNGIAIMPQQGTIGIASFRLYASLHLLILSSDTLLDTTVCGGVQMLSIVKSAEPDPPNEMVFQSGLEQRLHLYVQTPTIPKLSVINSASFQMTLDTVNSVFGKNRLIDSLGGTSRDTIFLCLATSDDSLYPFGPPMGIRIPNTHRYNFTYMAPFVQEWMHGTPNFGMVPIQGFSSTHGGGDEFSTLDKFVFYSPNDPDTTRSAKFQILYSIQPP